MLPAWANHWARLTLFNLYMWGIVELEICSVLLHFLNLRNISNLLINNRVALIWRLLLLTSVLNSQSPKTRDIRRFRGYRNVLGIPKNISVVVYLRNDLSVIQKWMIIRFWVTGDSIFRSCRVSELFVYYRIKSVLCMAKMTRNFLGVMASSSTTIRHLIQLELFVSG